MRRVPLLMDKTLEGCEILPMTNTVTISDMDMLRALLSNLPGRDDTAAEAAKEREPQLTKPPGSLGRLEEIALWLAAWQGRHPPATDKVAVRVFAGNHGVVARGVSAYPAEVTAQMVGNFEAGGAAVNQLCAQAGAELQVIALNLDAPTADFTMQPAMDEEEFVDAFGRGMASLPENTDLLCVGEMGIGNTTSAAAICMGLYGGNAKDWTGPGTGVTDHAFETKLKVVSDAVRHHGPHLIDGIKALQCLGGRELAAMAGAIIAARLNRVPVLLDGFMAGASAGALKSTSADAIDHCLTAHVSAEPGHRLLLENLAMSPLLNLNMRLGEASGATLAVNIVKAAAACHNGMATFAEANVSDKA